MGLRRKRREYRDQKWMRGRRGGREVAMQQGIRILSLVLSSDLSAWTALGSLRIKGVTPEEHAVLRQGKFHLRKIARTFSTLFGDSHAPAEEMSKWAEMD